MQISNSTRGNVTILHLMGELDSTNYTDVIVRAQELYDGGARNLLLDLEKVSYVSSAGLMAFHTMARIFAGHSIQNKEGSGRPTFRSINPKEDISVRDHFKLLSPQPSVLQALEVIGLKQYLEVFTDLESAVASFSA